MTASVPTSGAAAPGRLSDHLAQLDAARFVGRRGVLADVDRMLGADAPARIMFVHGPGGMGKSALLREIGRRARAGGIPVRTVDGRLLPLSAEALDAAFAAEAGTGPGFSGDPAHPSPRLILVDSFDQIGALAEVLRNQVLPSLGADVVVVVAGRQRPAPLWFRDGWEHVVADVPLAPLADAEADELLARYDLDETAVNRARGWAKGSPLALHVAAAADPLTTAPRDLAEVVAGRLIGDDLDGVAADVLAVAAIARAVDERLIADVLPHHADGSGFRQLRGLSVIEPYGTRIALHDLVRDAITGELRRHDADGYRHLVCRIADHLHDRIAAGEFALMDDLTGLFEDPLIRATYSRGRGTTFHAGRPLDGDAAALAELLDAGGTRWWAGVERFFSEAPDLVTVARRSGGELAGFSIATTSTAAPAWTEDDAVLGPYLAFVRANMPGESVLFWRDLVDLTHGAEGGEVVALLNYPANLVVDIPKARYFYGAIPVEDAAGMAMRVAVGAFQVPGLAIQDGERSLLTYSIDSGTGRQVDNARNLVHAEQGYPRRTIGEVATAPTDAVRTDAGDSVRAALLAFHDPVALAENPLAAGVGVVERAESVRSRLRAATDAAFGDSEAERALRRLVERAYLDPRGGHRPAMKEQYLARSTYFRRLGEAVARIAAAL